MTRSSVLFLYRSIISGANPGCRGGGHREKIRHIGSMILHISTMHLAPTIRGSDNDCIKQPVHIPSEASVLSGIVFVLHPAVFKTHNSRKS